MTVVHLPGEYTEDEVHDEEGAEHNHRHKVDELPRAALLFSAKMATKIHKIQYKLAFRKKWRCSGSDSKKLNQNLKCDVDELVGCLTVMDPVEDVRPALQGDALQDKDQYNETEIQRGQKAERFSFKGFN